jgi:uncharacterized protein YjbJ (UPF0337 family)
MFEERASGRAHQASGNKNIDDDVITDPTKSECTAMDKDRIKGSAEQAKGTVKETVGKVLGDKKLETEGKTDKAAGRFKMQLAD